MIGPPSRCRAIVVTIAALACLGGCASSTSTATDPLADADGAPGPIETRAASGTALPASLFTAEPRHRRFRRIVDGKDPGNINWLREATDRHGGEWVDRDGNRAEFWTTRPDGTIAMTAVLDRKKVALTLFEPPIIVAWPELPADEPRTVSTPMRIVSAEDPRRQLEKGTATRTMVYDADVTVRTPAGEFETRRLSISFDADLMFARAKTETAFYVSDERGVVAVESSETVSLFGVPGATKRQLWVLEEE